MHDLLQEFALSFSDAVFWIIGVICICDGYFQFLRSPENTWSKLLSKHDTRFRMSPKEYSHFIGGLLVAAGIWFLLATVNGFGAPLWLSVFLAVYLILIPVVAACF